MPVDQPVKTYKLFTMSELRFTSIDKIIESMEPEGVGRVTRHGKTILYLVSPWEFNNTERQLRDNEKALKALTTFPPTKDD